jgi:hypothetical protein
MFDRERAGTMRVPDHGGDDLRNLYAAPPRGARESGGCPEPDLILQAVLNELPKRKARDLADHAATCPVCAVAWRLARDHATESREFRVHPVRTRWRPMAAAAVVVAAVLAGILWIDRDRFREPEPPGYRKLSQNEIQSLMGEDSLPANEFILRWSDHGSGSRYDVLVTDRHLTVIAEARALTVTEYRVPKENLADLESGAVVLWRVDGLGPDGRQLTSQTFVTRLE